MNYWIKPAIDIDAPFVVVYRVTFSLDKATAIHFDFSADERGELFLDGQRIADGPERGSFTYWYRQHYTGTWSAGKHVLTARVLCFGKKLTAYAQTSIKHGFYLKTSGPLAGIIDTETGDWQCQPMSGISFHAPFPDWGTFPRFELDGQRFNWNILHGSGGEWFQVKSFIDPRELHAPDLPAMLFEPEYNFKSADVSDDINQNSPLTTCRWNQIDKIHIPTGSSKRILITFDAYFCGWVKLFFAGGINATVNMRWAETLYTSGLKDFDRINLKGPKGNRAEHADKYFIADASRLTLPGGNNSWSDYWWKAGIYFELTIDNPHEDLEIKLHFHRTGYPFLLDYSARSSSADLNKTMEVAVRTLQACSHETFMDCPYYEQLQYIGDTRIEALCTYVISNDSRLPAKALKTLLLPQKPDGMIFSQYPSKGEQIIPSFSMIYILTLHDFAMWRNHPETVMQLMPAARRIIDYLDAHLNGENLLHLPGWNFIDWVDTWKDGVPKGSESGTNCILNWLAIMALKKMAELEDYFGNSQTGAEYRKKAHVIEEAIYKNYFNDKRGLFSDDLDQKYYSEHAQVMALLSQSQPSQIKARLIDGLRNTQELSPADIYFSYYYLDACYLNGIDDLFFVRLEKWHELSRQNLKTFPENFNNPRSDCHAWSSHPLYHYYASILGIRPTSFGGKTLNISPRPGNLAYANGTMPHPSGNVDVRLRRCNNHIEMQYCVPESLLLTVMGQPVETSSGIIKIPCNR